MRRWLRSLFRRQEIQIEGCALAIKTFMKISNTEARCGK